MSADKSTSRWDFLGCEGDPRLIDWCSADWRKFVDENKCAAEAGEMGSEEFWYFFGVKIGPMIDNLDLSERKRYLGEYLAVFHKLEAVQANLLVEA